jgi:putative FmdB family regulatory protein
MPLYEYKCEKCGLIHEVIQKFSDPPLKKCPECTGPLQKLLSASAIQFKGSGWYVTDYANKGKTKESEDTDSGRSSSESAGIKSEKKSSKETVKPSTKKSDPDNP